MATLQNISSSAYPSPFGRHALLLRKAISSFLSRCLKTRKAGERLLILEERLSIGQKETLTLVQCAGRRYLVAAGGGNISLTEVPSVSMRRPRNRKEEQ
ncbi:flagellar biosynthetic protein FliO [Silvibacterium acidisoli]|uniref:flagellar biosynthetic protein FliO n=1 Tax=Acidobacteriaceae bacterium ZG23-2 TaxID=2883246 RepID=UPI00406D0E82